MAINRGYFDTHCHLNDDMYDEEEIEQIISDCHKSDVYKMICVATNLEDAKKALNIASLYEGVYASIGLHPCYISSKKELSSDDEIEIEKCCLNNNIVAIGECGLDYYRCKEKALQQKQIIEFTKQVKLSIKLNLPLIIHVRDAHEDLIKILETHPKAKGVIHCFTGNLTQAKKYLELGFYISFSGIITFRNSLDLQEVAKQIPLNRILIETDSPFLTPDPYRGQINYPWFVKLIAKKLSTLRQIHLDEIVKITSNNAFNLFGV